VKRKPVVAGMFYPNKSKELDEMITTFLQKADEEAETKEDYLGVVVPHAGYVYSGQCAAYGFNALKNRDLENIVIIAPSHRFGEFSFSVGDYDSYETPLGDMKVNREITSILLDDAEFSFLEAAHNYEHSLEVQLPFLKKLFPEVKIVPILIGNQSYYNAQYLADKLYDIFNGKLDSTAFIVSSDLSHYHPADLAEMLDSKLITYLEKMQSEELYKQNRSGNVEACGIGGILTMMQFAKILKKAKVELLNYTHSGKSSGANDSVVGYLAAGFKSE